MKYFLFVLSIKGNVTHRVVQAAHLDAAKTVLYGDVTPEDTIICKVFETTAPISQIA